jgi:hypothetical protein
MLQIMHGRAHPALTPVLARVARGAPTVGTAYERTCHRIEIALDCCSAPRILAGLGYKIWLVDYARPAHADDVTGADLEAPSGVPRPYQHQDVAQDRRLMSSFPVTNKSS